MWTVIGRMISYCKRSQIWLLTCIHLFLLDKGKIVDPYILFPHWTTVYIIEVPTSSQISLHNHTSSIFVYKHVNRTWHVIRVTHSTRIRFTWFCLVVDYVFQVTCFFLNWTVEADSRDGSACYGNLPPQDIEGKTTFYCLF